MSRFRCLTIAIVLACVSARAAAGEEVAVRVTDAETGKAVVAFECAVFDPASSSVRCRSSSGSCAGPVRAGERLYVYARGYDVLVVDLTEDQKSVTGTMTRCADRCTIRSAADGVVQVLESQVAAGFGGDGPVRVRTEHEVGADPVTVMLPRGAVTSLIVTGPDGALYWPLVSRPQPEEAIVVRRETARLLRVRFPGSPEVAPVLCFPDYSRQPGVEGARVDAWRWSLNRPGWLRDRFARGDGRIHVLPDVPFHVFLRVNDVPHYRYVTREIGAIDFRTPAVRSVASRPVVDGVPVVQGALVAPGRLDLLALSELVHARAWERGFAYLTGDPGAAWEAPSLPDAAWLTVWDRSRGVAYIAWKEGAALAGETEAGAVDVVVPERVEVRGTLSLVPVWRGAGAVRTVPPDEALRRSADGSRTRFRGLPPGRYALNADVRMTDATSGATVDGGGYREIDVSGAGAPLVLTLPIRAAR
jgi:hypothetical protein